MQNIGDINPAYEPYILWHAYKSKNVTPGLYLENTLFLISKHFTSQEPFFVFVSVYFGCLSQPSSADSISPSTVKFKSTEEGCERQPKYTETKRKVS